MNVTRQQEIFEAALDIKDDAERASLLDDACAGSHEMRAQLEELISVQGRAEKFFSDSITAIALSTEELKVADKFEEAAVGKLDEAIGSQIGPYRLLRRLAETAEQQKENLQREAQHLDQLRQSAEDRQKLLEATSLFGAGQNEPADALLEKILVSKPASEHAVMYRTLGDWHAAHARWQPAADRFARLIQINQSASLDTTMDDSRYAPVLVELDNAGEYDRFRESLIARYAGTDNPNIAERLVKVCLLKPAGNELMRALGRYSEVAEKSLAISSYNVDPVMAAWRSYSLALMAYRFGNYPLAIERCERSLAYDQGMQSRAASIQILLAMSHAKLGQPDQARRELAAGRQIIERHFPSGKVVTERWEGFWFDWLIAQIHLCEAEKLVQ